MKTGEVAKLFRVPEPTVRAWRYRGLGPKGTKVGRHVRYRRSDVLQWMTSLEREQEEARTYA